MLVRPIPATLISNLRHFLSCMISGFWLWHSPSNPPEPRQRATRLLEEYSTNEVYAPFNGVGV